MLDTNAIQNSFMDLLTAFSSQAASAFSSCLFYVQHSSLQTVDLFEKLIYNKGNQQEVYTKNERLIIEKILQYHICSEFYIFEKRQRILCRIIAIDLSFSSSLIHDAIAAMKICNKALEGYNLYILVGSDSIHVGCDILGDIARTGCAISYPIEKNINWDALLYSFLEIIDEKGFVKFYYSVIDAISDVHNCYDQTEQLAQGLCVPQNDFDDFGCDISDEILYVESGSQQEGNNNKFLDFLNEVEDAKRELSYITTNKVNTLEMLFEAEEQFEKAEKTPQVSDELEQTGDDNYDEYKDLLSNPEELIKALKSKNK